MEPFTALAHRTLKRFYKEAGLISGFTILDSDDQLRIIKRLVKEAGLDDGAWPPKQMQWQINSWKDEGIRADKVNDNGDFYAQTVKGIYKHYEEACLNDSLVDFAELLLKAYELVKSNKTVKDFFHNRFKAVLVDEFQDTNTIQYNWLKEVASKASTITAVGDDDQSIYGWRGAKVENIASFEASFEKAKIIRLEQNYRSTSVILSAANALIDNNQDRLGKNSMDRLAWRASPLLFTKHTTSKMKHDLLLEPLKIGWTMASFIKMSVLSIAPMHNPELWKKHYCALVFPIEFMVVSGSMSAWRLKMP